MLAPYEDRQDFTNALGQLLNSREPQNPPLVNNSPSSKCATNLRPAATSAISWISLAEQLFPMLRMLMQK